jgi:CRISPR/Cas system-associated endonuclease Cas1
MLVVRLFNLGIIKDDDFSNDPENGCRLEQEGRRKFFEQFEKRMTAEFKLSGETRGTCYRDLIRRSASAFSEALRTGKPYKPFEVR